MSATEKKWQVSFVVADYDHAPTWMQGLVEQTGQSFDDLVACMLQAEMDHAGRAFIARFPDLFKTGTDLV